MGYLAWKFESQMMGGRSGLDKKEMEHNTRWVRGLEAHGTSRDQLGKDTKDTLLVEDG
jgi:hypothetical protein